MAMNAIITAALAFSLTGCFPSKFDQPSIVDTLGVITCGQDSEKVARISDDGGGFVKYSLVAIDARTGKIREDVPGAKVVKANCFSQFSNYHRIRKLSDAVMISCDSTPEEAFIVYFHRNGELTVKIGDEIDAQTHAMNGTVFSDTDRRYFFAVIDTIVHGELVGTDVIAGRLKNGDQIGSVFGIAHSKIEPTASINREAIK